MIPELAHYLHMIEDLRSQVLDLIVDLPAEALNWRPLAEGEDHAVNSLAVMAAHIAGAEHFWMAEVIDRAPATRDRPAEFTTQVTDPSALVQRLEEVGTETRCAFDRLSAQSLDETRDVQGKRVTVRWAILHVIDHTALHLGHMQITYQLWMQGRSKPSPRWFQRVP